MRLTLRTLLAWLDDTLPPSEVREIGKQVSESPLARELVDRIHRVTRQRRHTVPGKSGPDATDPNLVAGYVDNDLEPDQVAEYEKKCLTSDVNLAEAACVHQILSLLGQKVQVPPEAKSRMYQLVRGRESIPPPRSDRASLGIKEPVTRPIQPWVAPEPPRRHWIERFGPVAGCLALLALLSWSAYQSLTPIPTETNVGTGLPQTAAQPENATVPTATPGAEVIIVPAPSPTESALAKDLAAAPPANPSGAAEGADSATKAAAKPEPVSARAVPSGAVGVVDKVGGMLLRFNGDKREWERIGDGTSLAASDRLLSLEPFRSRIVIAKTPITLIGETHLRVSGKATADAPAFDLAEGRVLVHETAGPPAPLKVEFAGRTLTIDRPSQGVVGLERVTRWSPGQPPTQAPPLAIHGAAGDLKLAVDQAKETLAGAGTVIADASGRLQARPDATIPAWMTDPDPSPKDQQLGEQFLQQFSPDRPVLAELVGATESDSPVTKKLAILAIKALGDLSLLTPILTKGGDPIARQSTATALRDLMSLGPQGGKLVREQLDAEFGDQTGSVIHKLLIGNTPEDASKPETLERLVELLSPRDHPLVVRDLALENLKAITGRGNEGYDPEKPDDKGWNAWKSLLSKGELKPASKRKAAG